MYIIYIIFIFVVLINYIDSYHITLYILCDNICSNINIDDTLLDLNELEYDNSKHYRFQKINFYAEPEQKITIIDHNNMGAFGIAAKIIIHANDYYVYDTKNNIDMFSSNMTDEINEIPLIECYTQTYADIWNELGYALCTNNYESYQNKAFEFYFITPKLANETLYVNNNIDFIMANSINININLNHYFNPNVS